MRAYHANRYRSKLSICWEQNGQRKMHEAVREMLLWEFWCLLNDYSSGEELGAS